MAPESCSLDRDGLRAQLERYRRAGDGATLLERGARRLVVRVADTARAGDIEQLIAVERECCPFFELAWEPELRTLVLAVADDEHGPALDALAYALGVTGRSAEPPHDH